MSSDDWWRKCLTRLAGHYGGIAGLVSHDFSRRNGDVLAASDGVSAELVETYRRISRHHPWAPYMWRDPVGTPIFAEEREVHERIADDRNSEPFIEALLLHNIVRGMGAILWKDRDVAPRWVIAVGILKHSSLSDFSVFSEAEQDGFLELVPGLTEVARRHPFVLGRQGIED